MNDVMANEDWKNKRILWKQKDYIALIILWWMDCGRDWSKFKFRCLR